MSRRNSIVDARMAIADEKLTLNFSTDENDTTFKCGCVTDKEDDSGYVFSGIHQVPIKDSQTLNHKRISETNLVRMSSTCNDACFVSNEFFSDTERESKQTLNTSVLIEEIEVEHFGLEYGVEDNPPIHMCFLFGLQQMILSISSTISIPMIVTEEICAGHLQRVQSEIMSTFLFMCGVCTLLQCTLGVRLPIIQGGCHKFIPAVAALMALEKWKCPDMADQDSRQGHGILNTTEATTALFFNSTNSDETEVWQSRIREIQGGIIIASVTQVFIGCTGLLGMMLQFIGPMTIVPTITLVGLSLVDVSLMFCQKHWGMACLTISLVVMFSLYFRDVQIPVVGWSRKKKCSVFRYPLFKLLPVILAVVIAWSISGILTHYNVFSDNPDKLDYYARTDARKGVISAANWFFMPYPGQWGWPTVSVASFMAMLAATLTSIIESVGDYYACARISSVPAPPTHAVNRGIAMEGIGSILSGLVGSGGATTSYSQNVGAIGFTRVASRRAFQMAGLIFIICGVVGKVGAFLTMLPQPVLGGIVVVSFGMVTTVGLSNLHFVSMASGRNMCILGLSLMLGLMVPRFLQRYPSAIDTGYTELDQVLLVLLSTSMFVGGMLGFVLDNTVPGTPEERGILKWRKQHETENSANEEPNKNLSVYNLPLVMPLLRKCKCAKYIPFLPTFDVNCEGTCKTSCKSRKKSKI